MGDDEMTASEAPDASASLVGGAWDAVKSGAYFVGDIAEAGFDAASGAVLAFDGFVMHAAGGIDRGLGSDGAGDLGQQAGDGFQAASSYMFGQAGKELGEVRDDVLGSNDPGYVTWANSGMGDMVAAAADGATANAAEDSGGQDDE